MTTPLHGSATHARSEATTHVSMKGLSTRHPFVAVLSFALAVFAAFAIAPGAEAVSSRNSDGPQGGNGAGLLAANEAIGTLPTWWVEDDAVLPLSFLAVMYDAYSSQVSFEAYVAEDQVQNLFVDAGGAGFALLNYTGAWVGNQPQIRVRVFGHVTVALNLAAAGAPGVSTVSRIGSAFDNGWVQWATGIKISSLMPVWSVGGGVALDLQTPKGLGMLDAGALSLSCFSPSGDTAGATATKFGGIVFYSQTL